MKIARMTAAAFLTVLVSLPSSTCIAQTAAPRAETFDGADGRLPEGWKVVSGDWRVADGELLSDSMASEAFITFGDPTWQNYEVEASITFQKVRNPSRWVSLLIRASQDGTTPWSQVPVRFDATQPNGMEFAVRTDSGWSIRRKGAAKSACKLYQPRHLKVVVNGSTIEGYLDGDLIVSSHLCVDRSTGCLGFGVSGCIATFDDFSVRHLPNSPNVPTTSTNRCDVVAHRGFSAVAPENTLAAIREAVRAGATGCEFDVYGCGDGTVVLMHDKTVNRTTNGEGQVTELSLQQLRKLDAGLWKHEKYTGERIPTLTEALQLLKGTDCQPVIEIKMEGISRKVVDEVRSLDMIDGVAVIAFSSSVVSEIRTLEPRMTCAWLCSKNLEGSPSQQADWLQARARECKAELLDLNYNMLSPELVAELKRRELGVWTWTVNEPVVMKALKQWGVDSITTDRPDLLRP